MKMQTTWDKYEVALLINSYIQIKSGAEEKISELQKLSEKLRRKAENEGLIIDEMFQDLKGMQWQLGFVDCAFNNKSFGTHSQSKMFRKMVDMYQSEKESFDEILRVAEEMVIGEISENIDLNHAVSDEQILQLVGRKFIYGFRVNSVIDMMKLRDYANDEGICLYEDDESLRRIIQENGLLMDGKIFIKSEVSQNELCALIDEIFSDGNAIIYYESLMENHISLMDNIHITSEQVLREYLSEVKSDCVFSKNYFSNQEKTTEQIAVSKEILRVWDDKITKSVEEISEQLFYIPEDKVRFYLAANINFVWVSEGVYTSVYKLVMSESEVEELLGYVEVEIERRGFVSLSDLPLDDALEENYELPELAVRMAVYNKYLSNEYYLKGKIITKGKDKFDAVSIMKQICMEKEEYTLDEAMDDVGKLIGINDRRIAYPALYDVMVRVDEQKFVAEKCVHFDVEAIDKVIDSFVNGFAAIKEITTFVLFPICGQPWTHYLLESYCYKYSKKYRYRMNLYNGRNAGAVVESNIDWDYNELLAQAAARAKIELEPDTVGQYLYETGYMARSKFNMLSDIAERAQQIREESV
ncbi:MAG: hypothetical protein II992_10265 [Lachnospiraceae bacterium]|nr:hypothetical protein [Lachnospiraceae bacterium]